MVMAESVDVLCCCAVAVCECANTLATVRLCADTVCTRLEKSVF